MTQRDRDILGHIINYCKRIHEYMERIDSCQETFVSDRMVQDACCMCIAQIGELTGLLSDEVKSEHSDIPWSAIKRTRNFYVHNYGNVDLGYVWSTIQDDIPDLQRQCEKFLAEDLKSEETNE